MKDGVYDEGFMVPEKVKRSFETIDKMPRELKSCVHEFGLPIVNSLVCAGITKPSVIRQIVHEIWCGTRETWMQNGGGFHGMMAKLDAVLVHGNVPMNAATLARIMHSSGFVIVPATALACMVTASMETVTPEDGPMSKKEKHKRRIDAALTAARKFMFPHL